MISSVRSGLGPLISDGVERDLGKIAGQKKFKAVRHVLQDEKDDRYAVARIFSGEFRS